MLTISRRTFTQQLSFLTLLLSTSSYNKIFASWQNTLFKERDVNSVIDLLTSNNQAKPSDQIHIKAPEIAENGAVVPITVSTDLSNVTKISILVDNNPSPLTSSFEIASHLDAFVSTRVKMAKSSNIIAIISTSDNEYFSATRSIKVTIGGCGG